jgi:hypothetical protein
MPEAQLSYIRDMTDFNLDYKEYSRRRNEHLDTSLLVVANYKQKESFSDITINCYHQRCEKYSFFFRAP